jgi:hypothetical protein
VKLEQVQKGIVVILVIDEVKKVHKVAGADWIARSSAFDCAVAAHLLHVGVDSALLPAA